MNKVTAKGYSAIFHCSLLVLCFFSTTAVKALQESGTGNSTGSHTNSHHEASGSDLFSEILSTNFPSITPSPSLTVTATDSDSTSDFTSSVPAESVTGTPMPDSLLPCTSSTIVNQLPDNFLTNFAKQHAIPLSLSKCLVIEASDSDISEELSQIEPDTLVLLKQYNPGEPSRKILVSRTQVLPKNAWIVGVNLYDLAAEVRIDADDDFKGKHWLQIGGNDNFDHVSIGKAGISHLDFRAPTDFKDTSIDSIVYSRCFIGRLFLLSSSFYLDRRASVYYQCFGHSNGDQSSLVYKNNRVYGYNINRIEKGLDDDSRQSLEGVFVEIPNTNNNSQAVIITDSQFFGNMKTGIEVTVGAESTAQVSRVEINKNSSGNVDHGLQLNPRAKVENALYKIESGYFNAQVPVELFGSMRVQFTNNTLAGERAMEQHHQDIGYTGLQQQNYGMLTFNPGSTGNQWNGEGSPYQFLQPYTGSLEFTDSDETSSLSPSSASDSSTTVSLTPTSSASDSSTTVSLTPTSSASDSSTTVSLTPTSSASDSSTTVSLTPTSTTQSSPPSSGVTIVYSITTILIFLVAALGLSF